ncbi:hypothetical protein [uncultured Phenylobacterium sp.]|uniref:hypothetical protein n=1 Tax=uncultured Phenylobacterium sp. TaxID=349273 RepID=UPI0025D1E68D|nr:hypothetical protein [uncultured Phenylobacterium sp.]
MTYSPRESGHPVLNTTRARQGRWGRQVFWVLVFGTVLAGLGMLLAYTWRGEADPAPGSVAAQQGIGPAYDTPAAPAVAPAPSPTSPGPATPAPQTP